MAAATDKRMVRMFTVSGVQREMFALPGPLVCIAGHGKQLMVVYHAGTGMLDRCQLLISKLDMTSLYSLSRDN